MWQLLPSHLLEVIFTRIRDYASSSLAGDRSLARLARVCKHWSEAALKLLWSRCSDLSFLVHTLPIEILGFSNRDGSLELVREPQVQDLEVFMAYSRRILQLTYYHRLPGTLHQLEPSMLSQMDDAIEVLFPNLQRLYFASVDAEGWYTIPHICSPRVTHLVLDFRMDIKGSLEVYFKSVQNVLSMVQSTLNSLKTFVVKLRKESPLLAKAITDVVQHWPSIRKLQVPLGGTSLPATFYRLCLMKNLVVGDFKVNVGSFDLERMHIPSNPFPSLRTLALDATIAFYLPIIQAIRSTNLNSIRLIFHEQCPCPTEAFHSVVQATCCATSSLQVFNLTITAPSSRRQLANLPTAATLLPLFAHRRLEELVIDFGVPLQLTDADLDTIAYMWPNIMKLGLTCRSSSATGADGWAPKATYHAIMALLFHLRNLVDLSIDFDASSLDVMGLGLDGEGQKSKGKSGPLRTSPLKVFNVNQSTPGMPLNVACWISILCPKLGEVQWAGEDKTWDKTNAVLKKIREMMV